MKHQQPCNRSSACAALDFAIPSPLTPDLGGGIRSPFTPYLTAQPAPAAGPLPQGSLTGLLPLEITPRVADSGLPQFAVIPQFGIALPSRSLARHLPRRIYFSNPAGLVSGFRQAHSLRFPYPSVPETARQNEPLASEPCPCGAGFTPNLEEHCLHRLTPSCTLPSVRPNG